MPIVQNTIDAQFSEGLKHTSYMQLTIWKGALKSVRPCLLDRTSHACFSTKTLILLGDTLGDWEEGEECRARAEALWRIVRRWNPRSASGDVDKALDNLRKELDELSTNLEKEQSEAYDARQVIGDVIARHEQEWQDLREELMMRTKDTRELARIDKLVREAKQKISEFG